MRLSKLASTRDTFNGNIHETLLKENALHSELLRKNDNTGYTFPNLSSPIPSGSLDLNHQYNICNSIEWCADGSSFVTRSEDNGLRLYIPSPTLLEDEDKQLVPFLRSYRPTPIICSVLHPISSIYDGLCATLVSQKDVPLRLMNLIPDENDKYQTLMSYKTQNYQTEEFLKIHSMEFLDRDRFVCGSNKLVSVFDLNRSEPIKEVRPQFGIASCITASNSEFSVLGGFYAGSFSNKISVFDSDYNVVENTVVTSGSGVTQLIESSNGKYLYVISRGSKTIDILDIRMGLNQVCQLGGFSSGNQKLKGDILPNSQGLLIGSDSGDLLWYKDVELGIECIPETIHLEDEAISSVVINPKEPTVLALAAGDRSSNHAQVSLQHMSQ